MRTQVNFDEGSKGDRCGIEVNDHGFGPCVIRGGGLHEALFGLVNAAQCLKYGFGAPMAAAAECYIGKCDHGSKLWRTMDVVKGGKFRRFRHGFVENSMVFQKTARHGEPN